MGFEQLIAMPLLILMALIVFGLLGAPFAALTCAIVARIRGLNDPHARTGAWYSMLFILPWLYLVLRMFDVRISDRLAHIGYAIVYGVWLYGAIFAIAGGFVSQDLFGGQEFRIGDSVLLISGGLFLACAWFASLRRLLRRNHTDSAVERSIPMRVAYTSLHALWILFATGLALAGWFELDVKDNTEWAQLLFWLSFAMVAIWVVAMINFRFRKADEWDHNANRPHSEMPLHNAYIEPFVHLYLLIVIPALSGMIMFIVGVLIFLSSSSWYG